MAAFTWHKPDIGIFVNRALGIGVGANPAGPVWLDHFFSNVMRFIIDILKNCTRLSRAPITAGPLQKSFLCPYLGFRTISILHHLSLPLCQSLELKVTEMCRSYMKQMVTTSHTLIHGVELDKCVTI